MKLRIKGNSVRMRLDRRDLAELIEVHRVEDALRFGPGDDQILSYAVEAGDAPSGRPRATYHSGRLIVTINVADLEAWNNSDRVGFDHEQAVEGGVVRVVLEKDFACLDRSSGAEPGDDWAFPNPSSDC
jgi:hypothetical protein